MPEIYCEFCGTAAAQKVKNPESWIQWTHDVSFDVVRCQQHREASKSNYRAYNPLTGRKKKTTREKININTTRGCLFVLDQISIDILNHLKIELKQSKSKIVRGLIAQAVLIDVDGTYEAMLNRDLDLDNGINDVIIAIKKW